MSIYQHLGLISHTQKPREFPVAPPSPLQNSLFPFQLDQGLYSLRAIPRKQNDEIFHFKMCVKQKTMIANLNKPYDSMDKDYF